jgi:hypothetical protein
MGVWFAVALHTLWAFLLLGSDAPKHATAIAELAAIFPAKSGLAIVLLSVAACAMYGIVKPAHTISSRVLLLTPQQFALGISAYGAIRAMWLSQFADGVHRPTTFLIADQSPAVLALLIHTTTIAYLALTPRWRSS